MVNHTPSIPHCSAWTTTSILRVAEEPRWHVEHQSEFDESLTYTPVRYSTLLKKVKAKFLMASHLRTTGCHQISCHTVLLAARHKLAQPALTPASKAGTQFTYLEGMEGWVDLGALITSRPRIEPVTAWSEVRRLTAAPPVINMIRSARRRDTRQLIQLLCNPITGISQPIPLYLEWNQHRHTHYEQITLTLSSVFVCSRNDRQVAGHLLRAFTARLNAVF